MVNDGSSDGTGQILEEIAERHQEKIHLIQFPKNRGKGIALREGIHYAVDQIPFDVLVTLDSDGQHNPSEISEVARGIKEGAALGIGCRCFRLMPFRSRFANTIISFLLRRLYPNAPIDNQSGFRAFSRTFASKIVDQVVGARYEMEFRCILLALRDRDRIWECPIQTIYLDHNRSSHFAKLKDSYRIILALIRHWRSKSL